MDAATFRTFQRSPRALWATPREAKLHDFSRSERVEEGILDRVEPPVGKERFGPGAARAYT